jgi:hypothetical protein
MHMMLTSGHPQPWPLTYVSSRGYDTQLQSAAVVRLVA